MSESIIPISIDRWYANAIREHGDEPQKLALSLFQDAQAEKPRPGPYTATAANILMKARNGEFSKSTVGLLRQLLAACKERNEQLCRDRIGDLTAGWEFKEWATKNGIVMPPTVRVDDLGTVGLFPIQGGVIRRRLVASCMYPEGCYPEPSDCQYRASGQVSGCETKVGS